MNFRNVLNFNPACLAVFALALAAFVTGCQSFGKSSDSSLASVTVSNRSQEQINMAINGVFRRHSFQGGLTGPGQYRFDRAGSPMNRLAYGDIFGEGVAVRVFVNVKPVDATSTTISCNAEIVQDPGDPIMEDAHKVTKLQKKAYQDLLDEVRTRLQ